MADDLRNTRVGFFFDGDESTPHMAAMLTIEDDQTLLEIPLADGITDAFTKWFDDWSAPPALIFVDHQGTVSLTGLHIRQHKQAWSGSGTGRGLLEAAQLVHCGPRAPDFRTVNAVRSEIAGLPRWMAPEVFGTSRKSDITGRVTAVTFNAKSVPATTFPGVPGLRLAPHFQIVHQWADGTHTMRETTQVETRFDEPQP